MRLWSVHPRYFDRQALAACWREGLLAQAVLADRTRGYQRHPQLERFRAHSSPSRAIGAFLCGIADEADTRGYTFNRAKILEVDDALEPIPVTVGQLAYEWAHLMSKLTVRSPAVAAEWEQTRLPESHVLFTLIEGSIASWEHPKS
ncbi:pyrimidine dimer DNA glycosylase/endonuclease V [Rathayibacter soli]|uniref:pyrimidine dimer DNA glycosylase/endonuclease V n=1 Tax=Rathayibacter soli TaxID=3144168 RepID=UPI0027E584BF|nr:pyrimidine dimer DNA glycosylase/endonuclease V [Glaciibacter superstes]